MKITVLIDNHTKSELIPEWGLSIWIEYEGHKILLDTGATGKFVENAAMMGVNLSQADCGVLSHAHYDHSDGLERFFDENQKAVFYLRENSKENCFEKHKSGFQYIGICPGYLKKFTKRLRYVKGEVELFPGAKLIPHKITGLDKLGERFGLYQEIENKMCPDCFDHEQSLVLETDQGLIIFNSCCHAGVETIIQEVKAEYPEERIYALIGGFHLFRSSEEEVHALAEQIKNLGIAKIYTGHCTGEKAMEILKAELGELVQEFYTGMEICI